MKLLLLVQLKLGLLGQEQVARPAKLQKQQSQKHLSCWWRQYTRPVHQTTLVGPGQRQVLEFARGPACVEMLNILCLGRRNGEAGGGRCLFPLPQVDPRIRTGRLTLVDSSKLRNSHCVDVFLAELSFAAHFVPFWNEWCSFVSIVCLFVLCLCVRRSEGGLLTTFRKRVSYGWVGVAPFLRLGACGEGDAEASPWPFPFLDFFKS